MKDSIRYIDISLLNIDRSYQPRRGNLKGPFDENAFGFCTAGLRPDGTFWLVDGQRRTDLAKRNGRTQVLCEVIQSTGRPFEALLFVRKNEQSGVSAGSKLRASIEGFDPAALRLQEIVEDAGFKLRFSGGSEWPYLASIAALNQAFNRGEDHLAIVLRLLTEMWPNDELAICGDFIRGFSRFIWLHGNDPVWNESTMKTKLLRYSPNQILGTYNIADGRSKFAQLGATMVRLYNKGRKTKILREKDNNQ